METLKFHWLGHPLVEWKGRPVKLETRKATALLAYLSLNPRECQREFLATLLWPERGQQKALANLRRTLCSLNSSLPGWIEAGRDVLALKRNNNLWIDVDVFRQSLLQVQEHRQSEKEMCDTCLSVLNKAVELCRGPFLEGLHLTDSPSFDEWQSFQREGLKAENAGALEKLVEHYLRTCEWEKAIAHTRSWMALDRLCEPAQRMLMRLYLLSGQKSAALRQYKECKRIVKQELGQPLEPETEKIYEEIRADLAPGEQRKPDSLVVPAPSFAPVIPLTKTKLFLPKMPRTIVHRPQLVSRLNRCVQLPLTLVSASAGFGKTTLLAEWVAQSKDLVAWVSLDRADNDPGRFFAYLIAAMQKINEDIGREIERALCSGQLPPLPMIATSLANDMVAVDVPFILVLDDFQVIQDRAILEVLETLLADPPEQFHLVLITREDPLLPLGRLRANHKMTEIRAADLRFSDRQVDVFFHDVMGLSLSDEDITTLENRTEGWAVGLQLAAIAMHGRADVCSFVAHLSGSHRYILSYLMEEVLSRQTEDVQIFLLRTSILEKLCGELCDALTGRTDSRALLENCVRANLFLIPLDDEGHWYRYHHLFQDLLLNQQSRFPKQDVLELHRRASQWYKEAGMINESMEHALIAADYPHAIQLLEDHAQAMIMQGYLKTVEGWMQSIPSEWHPQSPRANLAFAWMHLLRGNYEGVVPYLQRVGQIISEIQPDDEARTSLRAEWLALRATLLNVQGKPEHGIELANQALKWTSTEDHYVKSLAYAALGGSYRLMDNYVSSVEAYQLAIQNSRAGRHLTPEVLAVGWLTIMAVQHGNLHFAYEVGSQAIERLEREVAIHSPMVGALYISLGITCYEWNRLEKASRYLLQAVHLSSLSGHNAVVVYAKVMLARVLQAQGDSQAAARTAQEAAELLPLGVPAWLKPEVVTHLVRIYLHQENFVALEAALHSLGMSTQEGTVLFDPFGLPDPLTHKDWLKSILSIQFIHHQIQAGRTFQDLQPAIDLASRLVARALPLQHIQIALRALLLRAQMHFAQGKMEASLDDLRQAVELAEPQGYIRTFLDEGPVIAKLLKLSLERRTPQSDRQVHFIQQLLAPFPSMSVASKPSGVNSESAGSGQEETWVDRLTDREMDVLRLMAQGLKYREIAEQLFVTLNTVRYYVKEIYSKLNTNNRTRAIKIAHKLNLL